MEQNGNEGNGTEQNRTEQNITEQNSTIRYIHCNAVQFVLYRAIQKTAVRLSLTDSMHSTADQCKYIIVKHSKT